MFCAVPDSNIKDDKNLRRISEILIALNFINIFYQKSNIFNFFFRKKSMSQSLNTLFGVIIFHNFLPDSGAKF